MHKIIGYTHYLDLASGQVRLTSLKGLLRRNLGHFSNIQLEFYVFLRIHRMTGSEIAQNGLDLNPSQLSGRSVTE